MGQIPRYRTIHTIWHVPLVYLPGFVINPGKHRGCDNNRML